MGKKHICLFCFIALVGVLVLSGCQTDTFEYYIDNQKLGANETIPGAFFTEEVSVGDRLAFYTPVYVTDPSSLAQFLGALYQENAVLLEIKEYVDPVYLPLLELEDTSAYESHICVYGETEYCNWYYPIDRTDLKYLIMEKEDGSLSVWRYHAFRTGSSFFGNQKEVIQAIYAEHYPTATNFSEYTKEEENRLIFSD